MNFVFINYILAFLGVLAALVGAAAFSYKTWKHDVTSFDHDTIERLNDAYKALELENINLKAQVSKLESAVKSLEEANQVLRDTVTGRDILVQIQAALTKLEPYATSFDVFLTNSRLMIEKLDRLQAAK